MPKSTQLDRVVLHVDDDTGILDVGTASLRQTGEDVTVLVHDDPESALETLSSKPVDCVVSDSIQLADGTPFVERARDLDGTVPIVLFTGSEWDAVAETAETIEAASYVRKGSPDAFGELSRRVDAMLDGDEPTVRPHTLDDGWTVIGRHDWRTTVDLATTIVEAMTAHTAMDPAVVPPLFDVVDADALTVLLAPREHRGLAATDTHVETRFEWADHELRVTSAGTIAVRALDA